MLYPMLGSLLILSFIASSLERACPDFREVGVRQQLNKLPKHTREDYKTKKSAEPADVTNAGYYCGCNKYLVVTCRAVQ